MQDIVWHMSGSEHIHPYMALYSMYMYMYGVLLHTCTCTYIVNVHVCINVPKYNVYTSRLLPICLLWVWSDGDLGGVVGGGRPGGGRRGWRSRSVH